MKDKHYEKHWNAICSSELIPKIAEAFGLDDCCMQKVLRVEEGEYRLWKLASKHIPEQEHLNILALHVIAESWKAAEFDVFNARIHESAFSLLYVVSELTDSKYCSWVELCY